MAKLNVDKYHAMNRRTFLRATAGGSVVGSTALAGCSGQSNDEQNDSNGGDLGEKLPTYTYFNNPPNYDPARHDGINLIAEQMRKVGFDVKVSVFEWGTLLDKVYQQHDYDLATWNQSLKDEPGVRLPGMFHSKNASPGDGNWAGYENSQLDPKLQKQLQVDGEKRVSLLHEIQATLVEDAPMIPAIHSADLMTYNKKQVSGWVDTPKGYNYFENMTTIQVSNSKNELRGVWPETLDSLNPFGPTAKSYKNEYQFDVLYDKLVRINRNYEPDPKLSLATDWSRPNEKSVEYTIREGQQWHDGGDLTAEDVAFTLNYVKDNEVSIYSTQVDMIQSVERDGNVVRVTFGEAVGPVHSVFSNQIPIVPRHVWEGVNDPERRNVKNPVGSGPLQFDYWDKGSELGLTKYDGHWQGVNFDRRIWRIIPESSTVWSLLKQGTLNYIPQTQVGKQLQSNAKRDDIGVKSAASDATWHVTPNNRKSGFDDKAVRQAIHHVVPKTAIVEQLLYGYGTKGWNFVTSVFGKYSTEDVKQYEEGVDPAKNRLETAGYGWDDGGKLHFPKSES